MQATFHNYRRLLHHTQYACSRWCIVHCTALQQLWIYDSFDVCFLLNTARFQYLKCQDQQIPKTCRSIFIIWSSRNLKEGAHFLHLACQGRWRAPLSAVSCATAHRYLNFSTCYSVLLFACSVHWLGFLET